MGRPKKYNTEEERKAAAAERKRLARKSRISEDREISRQEDSQRKRLRRENESQEERNERLSNLSASQRIRIENESEEQRQTRLLNVAASHRHRIDNESENQRQNRLSHHAGLQRYRRENEPKEDRSIRQEKDRQIHTKRAIMCHNQVRAELQTRSSNVTNDESTIQEHSCGPMNDVCQNCGSLNFDSERPTDGYFTQCCHKGKVVLPVHDYPHLLTELMKKQHQQSKNFLDNIRSFNSAFAFASMGANIALPPGYGPSVFMIHGTIYHRTGTLHPADGDQPKFAQLYMYDSSDATERRQNLKENDKCNSDLMRLINNLIEEINPFAKAYKMLRDVEIEEEQKATERGIDPPNIVMAIKQDRNQETRRYNKPRVSEVAVVFENDDGEPPFNRDILIHLRPDPKNPLAPKTQRINILHSNLDALIYPIFFPRGEQSWHEELMQQGTNNRVTQLQYYSYMISVRNQFNPVLNGGKLTQQYFVDAYVKIEANRLNYIRTHQQDLRVEDYCVVQEHLQKQSIEKGVPIGKTVILPSSFEGSPRNMQQRYQDAMAIVTKYGKPDLFITMTCNPKWAEITDNLEEWQSVEHRPDLVARIFKMKLSNLIKDLQNGLFGTVTAMVHVIEFQKRGLPHAHILIVLDSEAKIQSEEDIDNIVWAEIPDEETYTELNKLVLSHMIHGPCGKVNPQCPCMENGKCTKGFPKKFTECTIKERDGYPIYRRRKGKTYNNRNKLIDNSSVVPYNPYLLKKYNCHINVEICASIKSVKYLFKYVYKGHDKASIEIKEKIANHDEPTNFVDSRYVSAPEAAWRIFAFPMHKQSHAIIRLAVHLPNTQQVFFNEADNSENVAQKLGRSSTLMAYFELNKSDENAWEYFYCEIPKHYTFSKGMWKPRKRGGSKIIGRMYTVSVKDQERYYLRLLLLHVKGAQSFKDLRTVNAVTFTTFKDTAKELGLLLDDGIWRETIQDATVLRMPKQLRDLFAYICIFGPPSNPLEIWEEFKPHFIEDFCLRLHNDVGECNMCVSCAMREVQDVLIVHGKSFEDFGLPQPAIQIQNPSEEFNEVSELTMAVEMMETLNQQQRIAFDTIVNALQSEEPIPKCFFIDGPGGSGKTYLYDVLMHFLRGNKELVLPAATTGIAANLLKGGRTMHSLYSIPIPVNETSVSGLKMHTNAARLLKRSKLFIIDECTMAPKHALSLIDQLLKEVMTENVANKNQIPFGGKVFVLGGDFRQCLPVIPNASRTEIVDCCLKMSSRWNNFTRLPLHNNMRSVDPDYSDWLLKLGNGELGNDYGLGEDVIEIPSDMLSSGSIVNDVFGENLVIDVTDNSSIKNVASNAILCPKNDDVDILNGEVMDKIPGEYVVYRGEDSIITDEEGERENYAVEFLNTLNPSGMPPYCLRLKVGTIVMLLRNLNTKKGLCNGTRLIVIGLHPNFIEGKVITGSAEGEIVFVPRIDLCPSETGLPFRLKRRQYPIKPAFAMTINKSQGQTLNRVGIHLREPVFGHGQLYVAFSRVKQRSNVKIQVIDSALQGKLLLNSNRVFTRNIVYKNVL